MTQPASFPIPVLDSRDDIDGELSVDRCSVVVDSGLVAIELAVSMDNPGIQERIKSGSAVFAMRMSCRRTYFRKTWSSESPEFKVQVPQYDLSDRIQLHPFVVAVDNFNGYRPSSLNEDYGDDTFSVRQGQILAIGQIQSANLDTSFDPLRNLDASIIRIGKDPDLDGPFRIDYESDQILLFIDDQAWVRYQSVKTRVPHTMMMSMVLPVVAEAIRQIQQPDAEDILGGFKWYQRLKQIFDARPHIQYATGSPLEIAQELLRSPHKRGLDELDRELFREGDE